MDKGIYVLTAFLAILLIYFLRVVYTINQYRNVQKGLIERLIKLNKPNEEYVPDIVEDQVVLDYSEHLLEYTKNITHSITVMKYQQFTESHNMQNTTETQIKNLISTISTEVFNSINMDNIKFDKILFNKEFYQNYIIMQTMYLISELLNEVE